MASFRLIVQYDGTDYAGYQIQPGVITIQGELERALTKLAGSPVRIVAAGRTDAGVHSEGQTISFPRGRLTVPANKLPYALNALLPRDIRVVGSEVVPCGFHARYDALEKTYRYQIYEGPFPNVFWRRYAYWSKHPLNWDLITRCSRLFVGRHDFAAFAASGSSVRTTVRTMKEVQVDSAGPLKTVRFTADGFLYKMVRNLMGTLLEVGLGKLTLEDVEDIIAGRDRTRAGATIAPAGLFLERVKYS
ncbi:MAG TPA: tRNA pseudouridine(38-40) synthase TruA [Firmicutes bacterium]|nr:tRNA pseudouridine(38-40) synthase TruA [Bacillota bacterium]